MPDGRGARRPAGRDPVSPALPRASSLVEPEIDRRPERPGYGGMPAEELLRHVVETGPTFYLAEINGHICLASDRFRDLAKETAERSGIDLVELLAVPKAVAELSGRDEVVRDLILPGPQLRRLSICHRPVRDQGGRLIAIIGTVDDTPPDILLARELARTQERLDDITRLVSDWVWETDAELTLSFVSPRIGEMLDYHPRELLKRRFAEFGAFPNGDPAFARAGGVHQPFRDIAYRVRLRSGDWRLAAEPIRPRLALSLNASNDTTRAEIMPITRKWNIAALLAATDALPLATREWVTFEYVLLGGVNDQPEHAREVLALLGKRRAKVNLIVWNPGPGIPYTQPTAAAVAHFQQFLVRNGLPTYIRRPRGRDIYAACGQLKRTVETTPHPELIQGILPAPTLHLVEHASPVE